MNFGHYFPGYSQPIPPAPPLHVWASNRGEPAAHFEVSTRDFGAAISEVREQGFERALVLVQ